MRSVTDLATGQCRVGKQRRRRRLSGELSAPVLVEEGIRRMSEASKRSNRIPRLWQAVEEFMADRAKKGVSYMGRESTAVSKNLDPDEIM